MIFGLVAHLNISNIGPQDISCGPNCKCAPSNGNFEPNLHTHAEMVTLETTYTEQNYNNQIISKNIAKNNSSGEYAYF